MKARVSPRLSVVGGPEEGEVSPPEGKLGTKGRGGFYIREAGVQGSPSAPLGPPDAHFPNPVREVGCIPGASFYLPTLSRVWPWALPTNSN